MRKYMDMYEVLNETSCGIAKIDKFTAEGFSAWRQDIPEGDYVRLCVNGECMMSNTPMEQRTSLPFMVNAFGDVLICGLGVGMVVLPLLADDSIKSITVLEKYEDVIDCVLPQLKPYDTSDKLKVIHCDCFEFTTDNKFDTIFIDIWAYINNDIYKEEMLPLKRKYRKYLSNYGKEHKNIFVWAEKEARYEKPLR